MVKVEIDLSKLEIEMLLNCIEAALDTKHMPIESEVRVNNIKEKLRKYI